MGWRFLVLVERVSAGGLWIVDAGGNWRLSQLHFLYSRPTALLVSHLESVGKLQQLAGELREVRLDLRWCRPEELPAAVHDISRLRVNSSEREGQDVVREVDSAHGVAPLDAMVTLWRQGARTRALVGPLRSRPVAALTVRVSYRLSDRSATIGSTRVARSVGVTHASATTTTRWRYDLRCGAKPGAARS